MKNEPTHGEMPWDTAPGDLPGETSHLREGLRTYLIGLAFAVGLTIASFWVAQTDLVYEPGIRVALIVFAVAQMGIHIVFFLHITTSPDSTNNVMALAFGILIVFLVVVGSVWIMDHLNHNLMPMDQMMPMQR